VPNQPLQKVGATMPYRYANFYEARPPVRERAVRNAYATLGGNHTPERLLGLVSQLSKPVIMASTTTRST
jgi:hypothetical protein